MMKKVVSIFLCLLLLLVMLAGCGENTRTVGDVTFTYNSGWRSEYFPIESEAYPHEYCKCSLNPSAYIAVHAYHLPSDLDGNEKEDLRNDKVESYIIGMIEGLGDTIDDDCKQEWLNEKVNNYIHGTPDIEYDTFILYKATEEDYGGIVPGVTVTIGSTNILDDLWYTNVIVASFVYKNAIYLVTFEMRSYYNDSDSTDACLSATEDYFKLLRSIETK